MGVERGGPGPSQRLSTPSPCHTRAAPSRPGSMRRHAMSPSTGEDGTAQDVLTAEANELIAGQYSDRPQLRPVFDALLAALPVVGPATVEARKTMVSFLTPRRTFAVVQPTTKTPVDLGRRLDPERPGGRLLVARDLGAATVRIPLTRPEDVDAEVLDWMRRAYRENAAPPPARRSPRRPAPKLGTLTVV